MAQSRPLPKEILDAFIEKVKYEASLGEFNSFYEEYADDKFEWTLDVQFHLSDEGYPSEMHSTISCIESATYDDVECANYHDWELGSIIAGECTRQWQMDYFDEMEYQKEMSRMEYHFNLSRI